MKPRRACEESSCVNRYPTVFSDSSDLRAACEAHLKP